MSGAIEHCTRRHIRNVNSRGKGERIRHHVLYSRTHSLIHYKHAEATFGIVLNTEKTKRRHATYMLAALRRAGHTKGVLNSTLDTRVSLAMIFCIIGCTSGITLDTQAMHQGTEIDTRAARERAC